MDPMTILAYFVVIFLTARSIATHINNHLKHRQETKAQHHREQTQGPDPICGCTHHYAYHDTNNGKACSADVRHITHTDDYGSPRQWEIRTCPCKIYTGPPPDHTPNPPPSNPFPHQRNTPNGDTP